MKTLDERAVWSDVTSMDATLDSKIFRAAGYLGLNPLADQAFRLVTKHIGVTGWQIARELNRPAKEVEKTLSDLVQIEVVKADGQGLNAYYAPSGEAFILRQRMAG